MGLLGKVGLVGVGFAMAVVVVEAGTPGAGRKAVQTTVNGGGSVLEGSGVLAGELGVATGTAISGAKQGLAASGLGGILDAPTTTVAPSGVGPARQPAAGTP